MLAGCNRMFVSYGLVGKGFSFVSFSRIALSPSPCHPRQSEKDVRELRESAQLLTEEYQRVETELAQNQHWKRLAEDRSNEIETLRSKLEYEKEEVVSLRIDKEQVC